MISHFEKVPVDKVVSTGKKKTRLETRGRSGGFSINSLFAKRVAQNTSGVATADLVGRQEKVDALEDVPKLRREVGRIGERSARIG